jgi:Acyl-protein synthetase, LuxE
MELFFEQKPGPCLAALLEAQKPIAALYELWVRGEQIDWNRLRGLHDSATVAAHRYYVESIPVYRKLAQELDLAQCNDPNVIRAELSSSDHLFKSYPQEWIDARDFKSMTEWAGQISSGRARPQLEGVETIDQWLEAMHQAGWILRFSSGTSGHLSFVPREGLTDRSLMHFTGRQWSHMAGRKPLPFDQFDGYFMVFAGGYQTISAQGAMLGKLCRSATYMYPEASSADLLRIAVRGPQNEAEATELTAFRARTGGRMEEHCTRILDGLVASAKAGRPILLYAPPFPLLDLCHRMEARGERIPPQPLASLMTGGGWKSFEDQRISRDDLLALAHDRLGFQPHQMHEGYGQSESNSHFNRCIHGRFHATPLSMPMVLDANQDIMPGGGVGRYAFVDPFITSYPGFVITGDEAELVDEACPCGLSGPAIVGEVRRAKGQEIKGCGGVIAAARG